MRGYVRKKTWVYLSQIQRCITIFPQSLRAHLGRPHVFLDTTSIHSTSQTAKFFTAPSMDVSTDTHIPTCKMYRLHVSVLCMYIYIYQLYIYIWWYTIYGYRYADIIWCIYIYRIYIWYCTYLYLHACNISIYASQSSCQISIVQDGCGTMGCLCRIF